MDERLIEARKLIKAVGNFCDVSDDEELQQVLREHPELLTEEANINTTFEFAIAQAREANETENAEFFEQYYQVLKAVQQNFAQKNDNPFAPSIQKARTAEEHHLHTGDKNSLDTAIDEWEYISKHPEFEKMEADFQLMVQNAIARTHSQRYSVKGLLADLTIALRTSEFVVAQTPPDSHDLPDYLNNLGNCFAERCSRSGDLDNYDLEDGIEAYRKAIDIEKTLQDTSDLPMYFNNLGVALLDLYLRLGKLSDLLEGLEFLRLAIKETPKNSPNLPICLNNLGNGFIYLYLLYPCHLRSLPDQEVIKKSPQDSPYTPPWFSSLSNSSLQKEIEAYQEAIKKSPQASPHIPPWFSSLSDRYLQRGIGAYQEAINKSPQDSPHMPAWLNNLGIGLKYRYSCLGDPKDLKEGINAFRRAVKLGEKYSLQEWLNSACNWLNWAFERGSWAEIEEAYLALQKASKQLVEKQLLREHKEAFLKDTQGIAVKVAYARIQTGHLTGAVEALEQGVARLLSSALARSDAALTQLQQDSPKLHKRYQQQLQAVNKAQHFYQSFYQNASKDRLEKARIKWQNEEKRFNKLLKKIRKLSGHENFLRIATDINTVKQVSQQQPLIYIFATEKGGYALKVFQEKFQPIELPKLTEATLSEKTNSDVQVNDAMTKWLHQTIMQPILQNISQLSHITLIPIGALNLLPLHAALYSTADNKRRYVLDDYTISYAPNALSLQTARNGAKRAKIKPEKCLLISNPTKDLLFCDTEIIAIQKYFDMPKKIEREQATKETVKSELKNDYSVLHFSCHGDVGFNDPLKTGLLMAKNNTLENNTLNVQDFLNARLNARLVSLSACKTGIIGKKHLDEVVGLPTSLLQAGAACVVSSLWAVETCSTMFLMMKFYEFFKNDNKKPATALREAQIWLRNATKDDLLKALRIVNTSSSPEEKTIEQKFEEYKSDKPYEHAYYWAAFYVTGE